MINSISHNITAWASTHSTYSASGLGPAPGELRLSGNQLSVWTGSSWEKMQVYRDSPTQLVLPHPTGGVYNSHCARPVFIDDAGIPRRTYKIVITIGTYTLLAYPTDDQQRIFARWFDTDIGKFAWGRSLQPVELYTVRTAVTYDVTFCISIRLVDTDYTYWNLKYANSGLNIKVLDDK